MTFPSEVIQDGDVVIEPSNTIELTLSEVQLLYDYLKNEWISYENIPLRQLIAKLSKFNELATGTSKTA